MLSQMPRPTLTHVVLQPDSQKSTTEHMGDKLKGTGDSIASTMQPEVRFSCFMMP